MCVAPPAVAMIVRRNQRMAHERVQHDLNKYRVERERG